MNTHIAIEIEGMRFDFAGKKSDALELGHVMAGSMFFNGDPARVIVAEEFVMDPTDGLLNREDFPTQLPVSEEEL